MKILNTQETKQVVKFAGGQVWSWSSLNDITRGHGQVLPWSSFALVKYYHQWSSLTLVKYVPGQVRPCSSCHALHSGSHSYWLQSYHRKGRGYLLFKSPINN